MPGPGPLQAMRKRQAIAAAGWVTGAAASLAAATWVRHAWVQAPGLAVWCESHASQWPCPGREAVVQAFIEHRLSTTALVLVVLAWALARFVPRSWAPSAASVMAWLALCVACAGLVLYDSDRAALAALGAALLGLDVASRPIQPTLDTGRERQP